MTALSVVIITFNEQENIERCIQSVKSIADEILVVDSFSTDNTVSIASKLGARVVSHEFEGHIEQKNYARLQATHSLVLSLDADEAIDETLHEEIESVIANPDADGYTMNRLNNYCGQWIRHGAWYPDIKCRLWFREKGEWTGMNPHDRFQMSTGSSTRKLRGNILHYSYKTEEEHRNKVDYFSTIAAMSYLKSNKNAGYLKISFSPVFRFLRDYLFKLGFLDGLNGLRIASLTAREVRLKYQKLEALRKSS